MCNRCEMCGNVEKPIRNVVICANARQYMQNLCDEGELSHNVCEPCTIRWLCDDCDMNQLDCIQL